MVQDTLKLNRELLHEFQGSGDYDYGRELVAPDFNLLDWIGRKIGDWLRDLFNTDDMLYLKPKFWLLVAIVLLILAIIYYVVRRPELFRRSGKKDQMDYEVTEDTIYGIDFDSALAKAAERGDWREAVRLVYLQTLRWLSDREMINWRPSKTPTQYTREISSDAFRQLTNHFMRVRYGNFKATKELFDECQQLALSVKEERGEQRVEKEYPHRNVEGGSFSGNAESGNRPGDEEKGGDRP